VSRAQEVVRSELGVLEEQTSSAPPSLHYKECRVEGLSVGVKKKDKGKRRGGNRKRG